MPMAATRTRSTTARGWGSWPGKTLTETFNYTIRDGDGDLSQATVTMTINCTDDRVTITVLGGNAEETVFENDLLDGSSTNIPL